MSEIDHELCRYLLRDQAVRAAEDAAAVPSIQHRDLPEQVALLWASVGDLIGRVVRLEGEMDAGQDDSASPAEGLRKERGESVRVVGTHAEAVAESVAGEGERNAFPGRIARLTAERDTATRERDAAIRERDEARRERDEARRMRIGFVPATTLTDLVQERDATRAECERLRARVAELEAAPPPRVKVPTWIHDDVRRCVIAAIRAAGGEVEG